MVANERKTPENFVLLIKGSCDLIYVNYAAIVAEKQRDSPAIIFQYNSAIIASLVPFRKQVDSDRV